MTPWTGGPLEGPLMEDSRVTLYFRGGDVLHSCRAGDYSWAHNGGDGDIVGYRPTPRPGD